MYLFAANFLRTAVLWTILRTSAQELQRTESAIGTEDYCQFENFRPRCPKNEAIYMKSARFGRMRIGRCITAEEVAAFGEDPRYLGCSADVLNVLDSNCTGKMSCDIRHSDISTGNIKPCFPGLNVYLEVSYECVVVVDKERSCTVTASMHPVHIVGQTESRRLCGTQSQPWVIEAPVGQKIRITLLDFSSSSSLGREGGKESCIGYGIIVDKTGGKRNVSICGGTTRRETTVFLSSGNSVEIVFQAFDETERTNNGIKFMLKVEAVGCSDLIPPEDAWLKRSENSVVIGCYSNRQTWHLHCEGEKWIGVFGNCSQGYEAIVESSETKKESWSDEQILAMIAVGGFTITICLAVLCIGIVCLRRFSNQGRKNQDYKVVNYATSSFPGSTADPQNLLDGTVYFPRREL